MFRVRTMARIAVAAGLVALAAAAAGCSQRPNRLGGYERAGGGVTTHLEIANPALQNYITLVKADGRRVNDILDVQVELRNTGPKARNFEYSFRWYDSEHREIRDTKAHWTPAQILGGDTMLVQMKAPTPDCVEYTMLVRSPAPVTR